MIAKKYNGMTYTQILDTMSNFRKYATKYKVWRIHPNRYCDKCWEDIERMKNGKPPVTEFYQYRDKTPKRPRTFLYYTLNGKGRYTCKELMKKLNLSRTAVVYNDKRKGKTECGKKIRLICPN